MDSGLAAGLRQGHTMGATTEVCFILMGFLVQGDED